MQPGLWDLYHLPSRKQVASWRRTTWPWPLRPRSLVDYRPIISLLAPSYTIGHSACTSISYGSVRYARDICCCYADFVVRGDGAHRLALGDHPSERFQARQKSLLYQLLCLTGWSVVWLRAEYEESECDRPGQPFLSVLGIETRGTAPLLSLSGQPAVIKYLEL